MHTLFATEVDQNEGGGCISSALDLRGPSLARAVCSSQRIQNERANHEEIAAEGVASEASRMFMRDEGDGIPKEGSSSGRSCCHLYLLRCTTNHENITVLAASLRHCRMLHCTHSYKPGRGIPSLTQLRSISVIVCKHRKQLQARIIVHKFRATLADVDLRCRDQQVPAEMSPAGAGYDEDQLW